MYSFRVHSLVAPNFPSSLASWEVEYCSHGHHWSRKAAEPKQVAVKVSRVLRARTGRAGPRGGGWGLTEDSRARDLVEGGLPQPALCIRDALREQCHPGPRPGLRATRMRLIFVLIDAHRQSSCTFQLHSFYVRGYSSLDLV